MKSAEGKNVKTTIIATGPNEVSKWSPWSTEFNATGCFAWFCVVRLQTWFECWKCTKKALFRVSKGRRSVYMKHRATNGVLSSRSWWEDQDGVLTCPKMLIWSGETRWNGVAVKHSSAKVLNIMMFQIFNYPIYRYYACLSWKFASRGNFWCWITWWHSFLPIPSLELFQWGEGTPQMPKWLSVVLLKWKLVSYSNFIRQTTWWHYFFLFSPYLWVGDKLFIIDHFIIFLSPKSCAAAFTTFVVALV